MGKAVRKISLSVLSALALAGCSLKPSEYLAGEFRGNEVEIATLNHIGAQRCITMGQRGTSGGITNVIIACSPKRDGPFDEILFNGQDIKELIQIRDHIGQNSTLYNYANPDSLEAAYDSVLAQNHKGGQK